MKKIINKEEIDSILVKRNGTHPVIEEALKLNIGEALQIENAEWNRKTPLSVYFAYKGILFDPPYSFTQVKEHYTLLGQKPTKKMTDMRFYETVKSLMCEKIEKGGYAISFGWNTNGFGKARGFRIVEIMAIAHGGSKNDTLVTVEVKIKS